ncbi:hypothetical protein QBC41DRAFT_321024 [Cercophora samala]|uniref:Uncharacterized protein n=1 Tax=Cercophora samala TaxID=330535 RepID=A0AA40D9Z6_9PEZI|nr:hypothetical protein QBC41DRAFT_321024 [Cercophora samala]
MAFFYFTFWHFFGGGEAYVRCLFICMGWNGMVILASYIRCIFFFFIHSFVNGGFCCCGCFSYLPTYTT